MLSKAIGAENARKIALKIADVKGPSGGRFYVNEHLAIFTPLNEHGDWSYRYIGQLDLDNWFGASQVSAPPVIRPYSMREEAVGYNEQTPKLGFDRLTIENFKSIGDVQSFELRSLNLLFGPNSAGKSSVVQAIHYLRQVILHRDFDASGSEIGGRFIDFDGFRNLVFQRESLDREIKIGVGFPFNVAVRCEFEELVVEHSFGDAFDDESLVRPTKRCDVRISIGRTQVDGRPTAKRLEIGFDAIPFVSIKADSEEANAYIESINLFHPLFGPVSSATMKRYADALEKHWSTLCAKSGVATSPDSVSLLACLLAQHEPFGDFPRRALPEITASAVQFPLWIVIYRSRRTRSDFLVLKTRKKSANEAIRASAFISELFSILILEPFAMCG